MKRRLQTLYEANDLLSGCWSLKHTNSSTLHIGYLSCPELYMTKTWRCRENKSLAFRVSLYTETYSSYLQIHISEVPVYLTWVPNRYSMVYLSFTQQSGLYSTVARSYQHDITICALPYTITSLFWNATLVGFYC